MADPYNYVIASPMDAFQKSYAFAKAIEDRNLAEQQRQAQGQAQQERAQQVNTALQSIVTDRSPENIARNLLLFPELKDQIAASESVLGDAEKKSANSLRAEVISLARSGNMTAARDRLATQAQAYANTPGKEREAQAANALLQAFDKNPDAVILPMTIQLAQSDNNFYKTLFENNDLDKDYKLNLQLYGKEQADAIRYGQQVARGFVTATGPAGSTYTWAGDLKPATAAATATGTPAPTGQAPIPTNEPVLNYTQASGMMNSLGNQGTANFLKRNNYRVRVNTPEEARNLPKGTKLILPDGSYGEVK